MAEQRNFIDVNGHQWAYLRKGRKGGIPFVIFHGFMCYADYFNYFCKHLGNSFDIIIPDLPGFGFTKKLDKNTFINITKGAKDFIEQLNLEKINIFGVSLGGAFALEYAIDYPEKTKLLILNSPFWGKNTFTKGVTENIEINLLKLPDKVLNILKTRFFFKNLANLVLAFDPTSKKIFRTHERETLEAVSLMDIDGNRELLNSLWDVNLQNRLGNYKKNTLLIAGLSDKVVTVNSVRDLYKIIGGDLVEIKKATHEFVIKRPDKLVKIISNYILDGKKTQEKDFIWE